jgi:hypothetical protein
MTGKQISDLEAGVRVQDFCLSHTAVLTPIAEFVVEKTGLDLALSKIHTAAQAQAKDLSGHATEKGVAKKNVIDAIMKYSLRAKIKAHQLGNVSLEQSLSHGVNYYVNVEAEAAVNRAIATKEAIKSNLGILTNITAANVTEMETKITAFQAVIGTPTASNQTKKAEGTDVIEALMPELHLRMDNIGDIVHSYFSGEVIANEFDLKSKSILVGNRHNHLLIHVEDTVESQPIANAVATDVKTGKKFTADGLGIVSIDRPTTGKHQFTIEAAGFETKTQFVIVKRSTTTEVVVQLAKN